MLRCPAPAAPVPKDGEKVALHHPIKEGAKLVIETANRSTMKSRNSTLESTETVTKVGAYWVTALRENEQEKVGNPVVEVSPKGVSRYSFGFKAGEEPGLVLKLPANAYLCRGFLAPSGGSATSSSSFPRRISPGRWSATTKTTRSEAPTLSERSGFLERIPPLGSNPPLAEMKQ